MVRGDLLKRWRLRALLVTACLLNAGSAWAVLPELVEAGQRAEALEALARGVDVNERSVDGTTALHWAVYQNDRELAARLIDLGADVDAANDYGATPVTTAALDGNAALLQLLLAAGAEPGARNADNETALMLAARSGNLDAARLLLAHGADLSATEQVGGQNALMWAAAHGHPEMVRLLLQGNPDKKADPEKRADADRKAGAAKNAGADETASADGETGVDVDASSTFHGWQRVVTAEPRIKTLYSGGFTALLYAAREGCRDCAQALLEAGASIEKSDPWGVTPLLMALLNMNFDTAALLVEHGADVNRWDWWGRTPLYAAIDLNTLPMGSRPDLPAADSRDGLALARMLLDRGADPDIRLKKEPPPRGGTGDRGQLEGNTDGYVLAVGATALHRAAKASDDAAMTLLIDHGADVNMPNQVWGITPLLAAAGVGHILGNFNEVPARGAYKTDAQALASVKLLQGAGADILARDKRGYTAAHGAAEMNWPATLRYLHAQGVPLDAVALNPTRLLPGGSYLYSNVPIAFPAPGPDASWTPLEVARNEGHQDMVALIRQLLEL